MNDNELISTLQSLRDLEPRKDILGAVYSRLFDTADKQVSPHAMHTTGMRGVTLSPFQWTLYVPVGLTFALLLVVANQLPMHGAYQNSITSIVSAERATEALEQSVDSISAIAAVKDATLQARATLDTLKLKGQWGMYTEAQCLHAYTIYDRHLDYIADLVDTKLPLVKDPVVQAAYQDLQVFVKDSQDEAQRRINMYPAGVRDEE